MKSSWRGYGLRLLVALLVIGLVASACAKKNESAPASSNSPSASASSTPEPSASQPVENEEPIEIVWLGEDPPEQDGNEVQVWLEKKFNVKITNIKLDNSVFADQMNIKLANKEIPDVLYGRFDYPTFADQGVLAELDFDEVRKYMPQYAASVDEVDPDMWKAKQINGKDYALPRYRASGSLPSLPLYRLDWMEKVGITKIPATLEELEDMCNRFVNNDPDGNGKKDTYCLTGFGKASLNQNFNLVQTAFDVALGFWREKTDGTLEYGMVTEDARQALKVLNRWFSNGYIDPEYPTTTAEGIWEKWVNGQVGMYERNGWLNLTPTVLPANRLLVAHPEARVTPGKPVTGPDGKGGNGLAGGVIQGAGISFGVQLEKDEKKRLKVYEILEALHSDKETAITTAYGFEGVHYDWVDGVVVAKPEWANDEHRALKVGTLFYNHFTPRYGFSALMEQYVEDEPTKQFRYEFLKGLKGISNKVNFIVPGTADYPDLPKLELEYMLKFVRGEVDLDKGFDDFVELWTNSGGKVLTENANKEYQARK